MVEGGKMCRNKKHMGGGLSVLGTFGMIIRTIIRYKYFVLFFFPSHFLAEKNCRFVSCIYVAMIKTKKKILVLLFLALTHILLSHAIKEHV